MRITIGYKFWRLQGLTFTFMPQKPVVLAIAPYQILPANTGGRLGIVGMHDAIGKYCECHVISTANNAPNTRYDFHLHPMLSDSPLRYLPKRSIPAIGALARRVKATHLFCDHPYMMPAAWHVSWEYGAPVYLRAHNIERERFRQLGKLWWPAMGYFERDSMRKAQATFFVTEEDRDWCVQHYKIASTRAHIAPFGVSWDKAPLDKDRARQWIAAEHQINPALPWLYFIGALGYGPNADAVRYIIREVVPRIENTGIRVKIIIGGKGLPDELEEEIKNLSGETIHYIGFIENLDYFLKACDVMLNPVLTGGGIKTKAVEALGYGKVVVSTQTGAAGISPEVCGENLLLVDDGDWDGFARKAIYALTIDPQIPDLFFETYYWGNIAKKVLTIMGAL